MSHRHLRVAPLPAEGALRDAMPAGADLRLLVFIFALHAFPLVSFAAGGLWGAGALGYATAVVLLTGRELVHELAACVGAASRTCSR